LSRLDGNRRVSESPEYHQAQGRRTSRRRLQFLVLVILLLSGAAAYSLSSAFTGPRTGTSSSSSVQGSTIISLGVVPRLLGPGTTMNYTLTLFLTGVSGPISLTSTGPAGLSVGIDPSELNPLGAQATADVKVHAADNLEPGQYQVTFRGNWSTGSASLTFDFKVVPHLVVLLTGSSGPGPFEPQTLTIGVGSSVTWLNLDQGSEYLGIRSVEVLGPNATSPALNLYDTWSYTFNQAGTYGVADPLNTGLAVVSTVIVKGG
jgi:plastocyanin